VGHYNRVGETATSIEITVRNLGQIRETTLDLRPLTVIIGPNNTNKTYLAYCVYGLLQAYCTHASELVDDAAHVLVRVLGESGLNEAARLVQEAAPELSGLWLVTAGEFFQDTSRRLSKGLVVDLRLPAGVIRSALDAEFRELEGELTGPNAPPVRSKERRRRVLAAAERAIGSLFPEPLFLPAERNAFIITYKMLATRRFRILRDRQRSFLSRKASEDRQIELLREQGDLRYPQPIEDFLDFLTDVELLPTDEPRPGPFSELADLVEAGVQGGNRTRFVSTRLGGRELKVDVPSGPTLDLYNASSSIKQLAPLLLFLRYQAEPGRMILIDEPEMNLHPESQARLLEALAMLVNLGVPVLLTTHSPYFLSHLNVLTGGDPKKKARRKRQAQHLYLQDERAFLDMEQVGAYEMREGGLQTLKDPDYGIRWDTLSDVSAEIQRRWFAIQDTK
jgi:hypothetical protein